MTLEQITKRLALVMAEWPMGSIVWHRADRRRGVLMGYSIVMGDEVALRIDYGAGGWSNEKLSAVQATRPPEDEDGEEWKEGAGV